MTGELPKVRRHRVHLLRVDSFGGLGYPSPVALDEVLKMEGRLPPSFSTKGSRARGRVRQILKIMGMRIRVDNDMC
jgi:hypothetical protein